MAARQEAGAVATRRIPALSSNWARGSTNRTAAAPAQSLSCFRAPPRASPKVIPRRAIRFQRVSASGDARDGSHYGERRRVPSSFSSGAGRGRASFSKRKSMR